MTNEEIDKELYDLEKRKQYLNKEKAKNRDNEVIASGLDKYVGKYYKHETQCQSTLYYRIDRIITYLNGVLTFIGPCVDESLTLINSQYEIITGMPHQIYLDYDDFKEISKDEFETAVKSVFKSCMPIEYNKFNDDIKYILDCVNIACNDGKIYTDNATLHELADRLKEAKEISDRLKKLL